MSTKNSKNIASRLDFMGLDQDSLKKLSNSQRVIETHLPGALSSFYERIMQTPEVSKMFAGNAHVDSAKTRQIGHWQSIASGTLDDQYMDASSRVGLRHAKIGLEPQWHIGGYAVLMEHLIRGVMTDMISDAFASNRKRFGLPVPRPQEEIKVDLCDLTETLIVILKAILLDVDIGVSAYFKKLTDDSRASESEARSKIENAVEATGRVLKLVASGDLRSEVTENLDPNFDEIKNDTNSVVSRLSEIIQQLQNSAESLHSASSEISAGMNDLSDRTVRQAAMVEETSASVEQLMATVSSNAARAATASEKANAVSTVSALAENTMTQANQAMSAIDASSKQIANIIDMIDDIAFQTNLLALNASVEAARAGDAGRGFAVVAQEVRRLAQSAKTSSSEISELIKHSTENVTSGVLLVSDAATQIRKVMRYSDESAKLIQEISIANREQENSINEVNVAIRQMDEMTQHNASLVEQTNMALEQTSSQTEMLGDLVSTFMVAKSEAPMSIIAQKAKLKSLATTIRSKR